MYKVFINDRPIILTDSLFMESDFELLNYKNIVIHEIIHKLKEGRINGVVLFCIHIEECWKQFKGHFKVISAAGGLVLNNNKEFLFIYRGNKWDLPKGRIEKGESIEETAVREVEEECGVSQLKLQDFLLTTYHVFYQKNQDRLKETHWFQMETSIEETLTPQLEEGITIAEFKNTENSKKALENTYANIHLVFDAYYKK
tara:strand:+ start:1705 stop:2304 length:600 start_codon:yes stop_codon:yes gene_type:complete